MTPIQIQVLLAIYAAGEVHAILAQPESPAVREATDWLENRGLIEHEDSTSYDVTDKGLCLIEAMKNLPMPVQTWSMPNV